MYAKTCCWYCQQALLPVPAEVPFSLEASPSHKDAAGSCAVVEPPSYAEGRIIKLVIITIQYLEDGKIVNSDFL